MILKTTSEDWAIASSGITYQLWAERTTPPGTLMIGVDKGSHYIIHGFYNGDINHKDLSGDFPPFIPKRCTRNATPIELIKARVDAVKKWKEEHTVKNFNF